jgi:hypothetical protein
LPDQKLSLLSSQAMQERAMLVVVIVYKQSSKAGNSYEKEQKMATTVKV